MHFECDFATFRIQTLTQSYPRKWCLEPFILIPSSVLGYRRTNEGDTLLCSKLILEQSVHCKFNT